MSVAAGCEGRQVVRVRVGALLVCAAVFFIIAAAVFFFEYALATRGVTGTGEIVKIRNGDTHPVYVVRFTTAAGRIVVAELMTSPGRGSVGDHLGVVYDPQDPQTVQPVDIDPYYLQVVLPAAAGVFFTAGGVWEYRKASRRKQRIEATPPT
ncbi:DUF3592 domain-containing protein [Parafrankia colletiae]|uniref:DUF3592 domain-containing protein n=1 Tax=Parafrankia colletiae TaxID=573497 RepID=UPI0010420C03|nr:DUF3592 domain-containing protein [Parafrankia colletiae]